MKEYNGLKMEMISFDASTDVIITSSLDNCGSVMAFSQAPEGTEGWIQCQEAIDAGKDDEGFGIYWYAPRGSGDPDV